MGNVSTSGDEMDSPLRRWLLRAAVGGSEPDQAYDPDAYGWIESVVDLETKPPLPRDTRISPVPPDAEMLRVEVVAQTDGAGDAADLQ